MTLPQNSANCLETIRSSRRNSSFCSPRNGGLLEGTAREFSSQLGSKRPSAMGGCFAFGLARRRLFSPLFVQEVVQ